MVIRTTLGMGQYKVNDHPYHAPQFSRFSTLRIADLDPSNSGAFSGQDSWLMIYTPYYQGNLWFIIFQMNVLSCGGVYRRITLALSACALVYLFIFHQDVPREFHFGVEYESEDSVSHGNDSLSHIAHISSVKKSSRSSLPDKCTDPKSDRSRIVFLKTHKTASSTIQNILMRYGTKVSTKNAISSWHSKGKFSAY